MDNGQTIAEDSVSVKEEELEFGATNRDLYGARPSAPSTLQIQSEEQSPSR